MLRRAGELAAQAPAGPVYVNTPVEVLLAPWKPAATAPVPANRVNGTVAVTHDVELAARLLAAAERPVLAVETAGRDPEAFAALGELAELLALPVVEPQSAVSSCFPRGNPLHAGRRARPARGRRGPGRPARLPVPVVPAERQAGRRDRAGDR